ncbi:MAG: GAF domain-containing protein [Candidatus Aquicultor sp.]
MYERSGKSDELQKELGKFRKLFFEAFDAVFIFDMDGSISDANESAEKLTGYSRQVLLRMNAFDLRPRQEHPRVQRILEDLRRLGMVRNVTDTHIKRKDGTLIPVEVSAKVIDVDRHPLILSIIRDITERKKIEAKITKRNQNLEILNKVALEVTSRVDLTDILTSVVKNAVDIVGGDAGTIGFYDEKHKALRYPYMYNVPRNLEKIINAKGSRLADYVMDTKKSVIIEDYPAYKKAMQEFVDVGVESIILVPISAKGTLFGALSVFGLVPQKRFTKRSLWLLEGIGRQAAVAVENARLFEKIRESERGLRDQNRNLRILSRMALEITSGLDLKRLLPIIVKRAVQIVDADAGAIGLYDEGTGTFTYQYIYRLPDILSKAKLRVGEGLTGEVLATRRPALVNDCTSYPGAPPEFIGCGMHAVVVTPLMVEDRLTGALLVAHLSEVKKFTGDDLSLIEAVGRQAAIAMENSHLFEETRQRARRSEAANEISRLISSTLELSEVLHLVINEISKAIGTEAGGIFFYQAEESRFYGKMGYGPASEHVEDIVEDAESFKMAIEAIRTGNAVLIKNASTDPRIPHRYVEMFGLRSVLVLPLIVKEKAIGVITLGHTDNVHEFDDDQIAFAKSIALQAAIAIENARLYEGERYVADVLQRSFLPETIPQIPNTDTAVFYTSSSDVGRVGGDFYDFIELSDNLLGLAIGDVSGKGIEAASTTALAKYTVRSFAFQSEHASAVMELSNKVIAREIEPGRFITLLYVIYNWESGRLLISNAGHPYPVHYVARLKRSHLVENVNAALGILPELSFSEAIERLDPGDMLVLYTDGLIEARHGPQFYGQERLMQIVTENADFSAADIVNRIVADVTTFTEGRLTDDIAISVLKRNSA